MDKHIKINSKKLLAVEGKDEDNFFKALLNKESIGGVQIIDIGGNTNFQNGLKLLSGLENFSDIMAIGFVRDAEEKHVDSVFTSICDILREHDLPVPSKPQKSISGPPKTSIFIMPDNQETGMLETLCLRSLEGRDIEKCLDQYVQCFKKCTVLSENYNEPKAKVLAYLASQSDIVNSLGLGALKGYWNFSHTCFDKLKEFVYDLFQS